MQFSQWRIGQRMALGFGLMIACLLSTIALSVWKQMQLAKLMTQQYEQPFAVSNAIARADANIVRINRALRDAVLADAHGVHERVKEMATLEAKVLEDLQLARARMVDGHKVLDDLEALLASWRPLRERAVALKLDGAQEDAIDQVQGPCAAKTAELVALRRTLYDSAMLQAAQFQEDARQIQRESLMHTLALGALALAMAALAVWRITGSITRPLAQAIGIAQAVSEGRLDVPVVESRAKLSH